MSSANPQSKRQPNVIVFFTDQQRWDCSGLHGNPLDLMPNFDRLATRGTHVYNSFTCQPVCGPARACLQTGTYATTNGSWKNHIALSKNFKTLAQCFKEGGYQTGYIGKWHLSLQEVVPPEDRGGYDYWFASNVLEFTSDAYDMKMYDAEGRKVKLPGYRVDAQTDAVIRYIDEHQEKPFFLFTSYIEPHFQNHVDDYPPPDGYRERYAGRWVPPDLAALGGTTQQHIAGYYGMVKRLDEALGRVQDALKSLGLERDTIVLFTSDHGCHFKTRNSEYKRSCHESSIRVPTALWGGPFESGGSLRQLVSLVDLPPSLLDAAGLPIPKQMQGRSILPLTRGQREGWQEEVFVQISESQVGRAVRTQRWKYCVVAEGVNGNEHPDADSYREDALYDLECDPYELRNLIDIESHRKVAAVMRDRLLRRMAEVGEKTPEILPPKTIKPAGQRRVTDDEARM